MPLNSAKLQHWIDNFYGYGSWDAPVWFIGYEEGGGAYSEVEDKLNYFYKPGNQNNGLSDVKNMHHAIPSSKNPTVNLGNLYFGSKPKRQPTWARLNKFLEGYHQLPIPQPNKFINANPFAKSALIELFPLPHSKVNGKWEYASNSWVNHSHFTNSSGQQWLLNRSSYESNVKQSRVINICNQYNKSNPEVVLCYMSFSRGSSKGSNQGEIRPEFLALANCLTVNGFQKKSCGGKIPFIYYHKANSIIIFCYHPTFRIKGTSNTDQYWWDLGNFASNVVKRNNPPCP